MCSVDTTLPGVSRLIVALCSLEESVWRKDVVRSLNVQEMVGTGMPIEVQEMFKLSPSLTVTMSSVPLLTLVLARTANKMHIILLGRLKC